jgi:hypothetical protein
MSLGIGPHDQGCGCPRCVSRRYPKPCTLCGKQIDSEQDLDWHGYGNCVEITDEMLIEVPQC